MANVTVRNLDDEVRRLLRIRAATNNRSMEAEIRHILTTIVAVPSVAPDEDAAEVSQDQGLESAEPSGRHTADEQVTDALTTRERMVADLIALGRTNRQIASALFLSERTVESHVGSILRKLSLPSRVAIATRFVHPPRDG